MKVVVAPDSFKGSLSAREAAEAIRDGLRRVWPEAEIELIPVADGGEGTVEALVAATEGRYLSAQVRDPLGRPIVARFGMLGDGETAVIEMAAASGLALLRPTERDPMRTTTYGTGELIRAALDAGARRIILGIGGSATNDGGAGVAEALGVRFLDRQGRSIPPGGGGLALLERIDLSGMDPRVAEVEVIVACDVENPLTGEQGASAVYGPQKGAGPEQVKVLDTNLRHYAEVIRRELGKEVEHLPGAGAAGGLGAGLLAFFNATLRRGVEIVLEAVHFSERVRGADLVITGEGELNGQTARGKAPLGVAQTAKRFGIPVVALVGSIAPDAGTVFSLGIDSAMTLVPGPVPLEQAMERTAHYLANAAERLARLLSATCFTRRETP
ncbi:MAG: glycerate kinase [Candidatus Poribacteria bacterium]|nr:MAG: glycerate kinase [Candidatus Poribacteria bacterium]